MNELLEIRHKIISFYKLFEAWFNFFAKFAAAFFIFYRISTLSFGFGAVKAFGIIFIFSVLSGVSGPFAFLGLIILAVGVFTYFSSVELAVLLVMGAFLILVFYARLFPKESLLIPAFLVCGYFKMPFIVPLFAGIYFGVSGIFPIFTGAFILKLLPYLKSFAEASPTSEFSVLGFPDAVIKIYGLFMEFLSADGTIIFSMVVFGIGVLSVFLISSFSFNYSKETAIAFSGGIMIVLFMIGEVFGKSSFGMLTVFFFGILSVLIMEAIRFFDSVLDYKASKKVQFEDDEYYYYVKAIPKRIVKDFNFDNESSLRNVKPPEKIKGFE